MNFEVKGSKMISFTDGSLEEISTTIGGQKPETGGALFGPENANLISAFIFDPEAETTAVSYKPSVDLINRIPEFEAREHVIFKGIIHSHPKGMPRPSEPDHIAFWNTLRTNPRLRSLVTPIVTFERRREGSNLIVLNDRAIMRLYQAFWCAS